MGGRGSFTKRVSVSVITQNSEAFVDKRVALQQMASRLEEEFNAKKVSYDSYRKLVDQYSEEVFQGKRVPMKDRTVVDQWHSTYYRKMSEYYRNGGLKFYTESGEKYYVHESDPRVRESSSMQQAFSGVKEANQRLDAVFEKSRSFKVKEDFYVERWVKKVGNLEFGKTFNMLHNHLDKLDGTTEEFAKTEKQLNNYIDKKIIGGTFTFPGPTATTVGGTPLIRKGNAVLRLKIPKGSTPGIMVHAYTEGAQATERELLLRPYSKMKVTKVYYDGTDVIVEGEYVDV